MNPGYGKDSKSFQKINPHLFPGSGPYHRPEYNPAVVEIKLLRQKKRKLNKTEQSFGDFLRAQEVKHLCEQKLTFELANGVRYTPDCTGYFLGEFCAWEVKGFMREDAAVKIKMAAQQFPWIRWRLVKRLPKGQWGFQDILP